MPSLIDVLLLVALPASGKSELRRYLASLTPRQCEDEMHLGHTVQLDDYPYVHAMRRISQELRARGHDGIYFDSDELPMKEQRDWCALIELLNEDFDDLMHLRRVTLPSEPGRAVAAEWLFDRFDAARRKLGIRPAFGQLEPGMRAEIARVLDKEFAMLLADKNAGIPDTLKDKTVVIEMARGGPDKSTMPLPAPFGYRYAFATLSQEILSRASVLYVWVTPEESRRKNIERHDPGKPGSILHHGVPMSVMLGEYGCDDMEWLIQHSDRPDTVRIEAHGRSWHLPVATFDNRVDKTSFVRADRSQWKESDMKALHQALAEAFGRLAKATSAIR